MDATCTIQNSIHVFRLVRQYVSRILGTYQCVIFLPNAFLMPTLNFGFAVYCNFQYAIVTLK